MAFPSSPVNGQTTIVNGFTYVYSSANNAWKRVSGTSLNLAGTLTVANTTQSTSTSTGAVTVSGGLGVQGNVTAGNLAVVGQTTLSTATLANATFTTDSLFTGNLLPSANVTYNLGSPTQRWRTAYLAGNTLDLGGTTISANATSFSINHPSGAAFSVNNTNTGSFGNLNIAGNLTAATIYDNSIRVITGLTSSSTGNVTVSGSAPSLTVALTQTGPGVTTVGGSTSIPVITTDAYGRITALTSASITTTLSTSGTGGTGTVALASQSLNITGNTGIYTTASGQTITVSLATMGPGVTTVGNTTTIPVITTDSYGRISALSTASISTILNTSGNVGTGSVSLATQSLAITGNTGIYVTASGQSLNVSLATMGPGVTTVGNTTTIPVITTDAYGRISSLSTASISTTLNTAGTSGTGAVGLASQTLTFSSTNGIVVAASGANVTISTPQNLQTTATPTFAGLTTNGNTAINSSLYVSGITNITNSTVSTGAGNGALIVSGGIGVTGTSYYGGDLYVTGNIFTPNLVATNATTLNTTSPMVYFQATPYPYNFETGFYSHFVGGPANVYTHTGFVRNHNNNLWALFSNVKTEPTTTTINFADAGLIWDTLQLGGIVVSNATPSNSTTTGAVTVAGGVGISGNLNVNTAAYIGYNAINTTLTNPTIVATSTSTSVTAGQYYVQNALINNASSGSADFIAYGNNYPGAVVSDHGWMDMGFTGNTFSDPNFGITKSNDGYLFASAVAGSGLGGNLVLATDYTGGYNDIVFATGSFAANAEVARFHGNASNGGYLQVTTGTQSTSTTTGALKVTGGIGATGNVNIGGNLAVTNNLTVSGSISGYVNGLNSAPATGNSFEYLVGTIGYLGTPTIDISNPIGFAANTGYLGINTTNPTTALTVFGTTTTNAAIITNTTTSTTTGTGALTVAGGVGVVGNVNVGGTVSAPTISGTLTTATQTNITSVGNLTTLSVAGTTTKYGVLSVLNTTTSTSTVTGALQVAGGAGIAGNVNIGGNLTVGGAPFNWGSNFSTLDLTASAVNAVSGGLRLFLYGNAYENINDYYKNNGYALKYSLDSSLGSHIWATAPSGTAGAQATYTQMMALSNGGQLSLSANTVSTSTTTGVLTVAGGVGIVGSTNIGGTTTTALLQVGTTNANLGSAVNKLTISNGTSTGGVSNGYDVNMQLGASTLYNVVASSSFNGLVITNNWTGANQQGTSSLPSWFVDIGGRGTYALDAITFGRIAPGAGSTSQMMVLNSSGTLLVGYTSGNNVTNIETNNISVGQVGTASTTSRLRFAPQTVGYNVINLHNNNSSTGGGLVFTTGDNSTMSTNTPIMSLLATGNLGIGTTTPPALLSVASATSTGPSTTTAWTNGYSVFGPNAGSTTGAALALGYNTSLGAGEIYALAPNVAWKPLNLYGNTVNLYYSGSTLVASTASTGLNVTGITSSTGGYQYTAYNSGRNRIWSFGNSDGYGLAYFQGSGGFNGTSDMIGMHFGTATAAASQFSFVSNGNMYATGDIYSAYSDIRLKTKLGDITGAVNMVCAIETLYYEPNEAAIKLGATPGRRIGVSAQSVEAVVPEAVGTSTLGEGHLTIQYERLVPVLIESIKELKSEIEELRAEIKELKEGR